RTSDFGLWTDLLAASQALDRPPQLRLPLERKNEQPLRREHDGGISNPRGQDGEIGENKILVLIGWAPQIPDRSPGPDVAPPGTQGECADAIRLFHHGKVDRDVRKFFVSAPRGLRVPRSKRPAVALDAGHQLPCHAACLADQPRRSENEDAGIPEEAGFDVL